jgi:hypothetical protein
MASKSGNVILYKDAVYTYLHLQYNGFFTLAVFALLFNRIENLFSATGLKNMNRFARLLNISIIPSLFLCYLWHYPNTAFRIIAVTGSISMIMTFCFFLVTMFPLQKMRNKVSGITFYIAILSMLSFALKMVLQSLTIFEKIGAEVFSNRPVIIGFLHLVLLCFITLYILSHFSHTGVLKNNKLSQTAIAVFTTSVVVNEVLLMSQGLGIMLMESSKLFPWLLWTASIGLVMGSVLLITARLKSMKYNIATTDTKLSPEFKMLYIKHK